MKQHVILWKVIKKHLALFLCQQYIKFNNSSFLTHNSTVPDTHWIETRPHDSESKNCIEVVIKEENHNQFADYVQHVHYVKYWLPTPPKNRKNTCICSQHAIFF